MSARAADEQWPQNKHSHQTFQGELCLHPLRQPQDTTTPPWAKRRSYFDSAGRILRDSDYFEYWRLRKVSNSGRSHLSFRRSRTATLSPVRRFFSSPAGLCTRRCCSEVYGFKALAGLLSVSFVAAAFAGCFLRLLPCRPPATMRIRGVRHYSPVPYGDFAGSPLGYRTVSF